MKFCARCSTSKPLDHFAPDRRRRDGRVSYCRACRADISKAYRAANPDKIRANFQQWKDRNPDRIRARSAERHLTKRAQSLIAHARTRARRKSLPFDLDDLAATQDIERRVNLGRCELTGLPFDFTPGRTFASPSLDRRNPVLGYTWANVRVVCHGINVAMGDWGEDVMSLVIIRYLRQRFGDAIDVEAFTNLIGAYMDAAPSVRAAA